MTDHQAEKTNTQEVKSFELTDRQKIIRDAKKEDMLVSASAGTGKEGHSDYAPYRWYSYTHGCLMQGGHSNVTTGSFRWW